jgi:hypothetical protein
MAHEGNTECLFAAATKLSADTAKMDPVFHASLTRMAGNRKVYRPGWRKVIKQYTKQYAKVDEEADSDGSEGSDISI